jgi:hypothetical protein
VCVCERELVCVCVCFYVSVRGMCKCGVCVFVWARARHLVHGVCVFIKLVFFCVLITYRPYCQESINSRFRSLGWCARLKVYVLTVLIARA